jgi:hypothetical protein
MHSKPGRAIIINIIIRTPGRRGAAGAGSSGGQAAKT